MTPRASAGLLVLLLAGCAAPARDGPPAAPPAAAAAIEPPEPGAGPPVPAIAPLGSTRWSCDGGRELLVTRVADDLLLSGWTDTAQALGRDAGGVTPTQTVWSNERFRLELGLGPDGREAVLQVLGDPATLVRCVRR